MRLIGPQMCRFGRVCTIVCKIWFIYNGQCVSTHTLSHSTLFFYMDPQTNDQGLGYYLQPFQIGPPMGPYRHSSRHVLAEKQRFLGDLRQPLGTLGLLLG